MYYHTQTIKQLNALHQKRGLTKCRYMFRPLYLSAPKSNGCEMELSGGFWNFTKGYWVEADRVDTLRTPLSCYWSGVDRTSQRYHFCFHSLLYDIQARFNALPNSSKYPYSCMCEYKRASVVRETICRAQIESPSFLISCSSTLHRLIQFTGADGAIGTSNGSWRLPSLPLVRLVVLERKATRPLIRASLPANPTIAAGKQNAPESNRSEEGRAKRS
jgi:hypothetical protein